MNREIVREGYDRAAESYARGRDQFSSLPYLERLRERLPPGAAVLDVGCGAGLPVDRYLVEQGYRVTGIDLSEAQVALARANVPEGSFLVRDMVDLAVGEYAVDAVVSFYAIFHTPREGHAALFRTFHTFLPADGLLLVTMGAGDWEGVEDGFHGVRMWWSHYDSIANRRLIEDAGFAILLDEIDRQHNERHQVVLAARR